MNKPFKLDIELIIKLSLYGWFYYSVHQYNDGLLRLIKRNDLQEIVITNVIELQSRTNTSKKFPRSGINIIHEGQQIFHAPCIGVEQFCKPYQLTTLPSNTTVVLLWTRNVLDVPDKGVKNGLIKEIKSPTGKLLPMETVKSMNIFPLCVKNSSLVGYLNFLPLHHWLGF